MTQKQPSGVSFGIHEMLDADGRGTGLYKKTRSSTIRGEPPFLFCDHQHKTKEEAAACEQVSPRLPRPRDPLALAKLIGDIATGQVEDKNEDGKNANAANLGRLGGAARARKLSPEQRAEIAKKAAAKRWSKGSQG